MTRGTVFARYFEALFDGDPVALGVTAGLFLLILPILIVWYKVARDDRKEREERENRYKKK